MLLQEALPAPAGLTASRERDKSILPVRVPDASSGLAGWVPPGVAGGFPATLFAPQLCTVSPSTSGHGSLAWSDRLRRIARSVIWAKSGQKAVGVDINENVVRAIKERTMSGDFKKHINLWQRI